MLEYLFIGSGFAFAAAIQPGPLQAFLLSSVACKGWKRTLPAACAPLLSDGPIVLLVLLVLNRVPETMSRFLQAAGGVLLIYLACTILLFGTTRFLGPRGRHALVLVSAITLAALGVYQLVASLLRMGAP